MVLLMVSSPLSPPPPISEAMGQPRSSGVSILTKFVLPGFHCSKELETKCLYFKGILWWKDISVLHSWYSLIMIYTFLLEVLSSTNHPRGLSDKSSSRLCFFFLVKDDLRGLFKECGVIADIVIMEDTHKRRRNYG